MARKSWGVEILNNFVIDNLKAYAWCNLWEVTPPDKNHRFDFKMCVRPNTYDRTPKSEFGGSFHYGSNQYWKHIPSSNSLEFPDAEFFQSYALAISMLGGESERGGKCLDNDPQRKFKYWNYLANQCIRAIELIDLEDRDQTTNVKEVFGYNKETTPNANGWEKVSAYAVGSPREQWAFI